MKALRVAVVVAEVQHRNGFGFVRLPACGKPRRRVVALRFTDDEHEALSAEAVRAGLALADYLRQKILGGA